MLPPSRSNRISPADSLFEFRAWSWFTSPAARIRLPELGIPPPLAAREGRNTERLRVVVSRSCLRACSSGDVLSKLNDAIVAENRPRCRTGSRRTEQRGSPACGRLLIAQSARQDIVGLQWETRGPPTAGCTSTPSFCSLDRRGIRRRDSSLSYANRLKQLAASMQNQNSRANWRVISCRCCNRERGPACFRAAVWSDWKPG